ncbi:hypothetical protein GJ496_002872 [Pomphorhynchus laevis]|nr:hypothetical protein GJ496_002872 [Pomphorhynchus laevis]
MSAYSPQKCSAILYPIRWNAGQISGCGLVFGNGKYLSFTMLWSRRRNTFEYGYKLRRENLTGFAVLFVSL